MRPIFAGGSVLLTVAALFAGCKGSPTEPAQPVATGPLTGSWHGTITYKEFPGPCPASEAVDVDVTEAIDGHVTAVFSTACVAHGSFVGSAASGNLTGELKISQNTCREEGGFVSATGESTGTYSSVHIQIETPEIGTADCGFGGNRLDLERSR